MSRMIKEENGEVKRTLNKAETTSYGYESVYPTYTTTSTGSTVAQPLPGQPPLPPMPPPPGALPPLPMFSAVPQVTPLQTWAHAAPTWQWITPQTTPMPPQSNRDLTNSTLQSNMGNYNRRDRFNHNRNNVYPQRGNFHRNKNRRRFDHQAQHSQLNPAAYFGQTIAGGIGIDWQRANFAGSQGDGLVNHMAVPMPSQVNNVTNNASSERAEMGDLDMKIASLQEVPVKKTKQRKPMSQSYPIRNWNLEDAKSALKVENEYNKTVRAQSLIIKFPDPDLNKDIVREFHPGIQNIHFQSPSGPRYCFIQMAKDVDIDKAIADLEKIPFGVGHLKAERKSLRDEDYPQPEEIDPYTLYVGNLPESVNVNEVKSKFPTATRVDVGYAQKMRNTRYAFIRYANVEESIAAYKQAHDLMWDTRSIIVRFRRQRGNTCLPGETKNNAKKVKDEPKDGGVKNERVACNGTQKAAQKVCETNEQESVAANGAEKSSNVATVTPTPAPQQQNQPWKSKSPQTASAAEPPPAEDTIGNATQDVIITTIKEEPEDYDEMDMSYIPGSDDDSDDENDEPDEMDDTNDEMDENDNEPDDNDDSDNLTDCGEKDQQNDDVNSDAPDHLDHMFNELGNIGDIEL